MLFNVLLIEDEPSWSEPMQSGLRGTIGEGSASASVSDTSGKARADWHANRWHVLSHDVLMPERKGEEAEFEKGFVLLDWHQRGIGSKLVLSGLTNQKKTHNLFSKTGRLDIQVFGKPPGYGIPDDIFLLDAKRWSNLVKACLASPLVTEQFPFPDIDPRGTKFENSRQSQLRYRDVYWRLARERLPYSLAHSAAKVEPVCTTGIAEALDPNVLAAVSTFWRWTLQLAWAQSHVIGRHAKQPQASRLVGESAVTVEDELKLLMTGPQSKALQSACPAWWQYLSEGKGIDKGLQGLRQRRNREAHSPHTMDRVVRDFWTEWDEPLLYTMDIAAFWASYPLYGNLRKEGDLMTGERLQGTNRIGERETLAGWPSTLTPVAEHVYQRIPWRQGDALSFAWVDWYPYLRRVPDADRLHASLLLLMHGPRSSGAPWRAQNMSSAQLVDVAEKGI